MSSTNFSTLNLLQGYGVKAYVGETRTQYTWGERIEFWLAHTRTIEVYSHVHGEENVYVMVEWRCDEVDDNNADATKEWHPVRWWTRGAFLDELDTLRAEYSLRAVSNKVSVGWCTH